MFFLLFFYSPSCFSSFLLPVDRVCCSSMNRCHACCSSPNLPACSLAAAASIFTSSSSHELRKRRIQAHVCSPANATTIFTTPSLCKLWESQIQASPPSSPPIPPCASSEEAGSKALPPSSPPPRASSGEIGSKAPPPSSPPPPPSSLVAPHPRHNAQGGGGSGWRGDGGRHQRRLLLHLRVLQGCRLPRMPTSSVATPPSQTAPSSRCPSLSSTSPTP